MLEILLDKDTVLWEEESLLCDQLKVCALGFPLLGLFKPGIAF